MNDTPQQQAARRLELEVALHDFRVPHGYGKSRHRPYRNIPARAVVVVAPCLTCNPDIPSRLPAGLAPEAD